MQVSVALGDPDSYRSLLFSRKPRIRASCAMDRQMLRDWVHRYNAGDVQAVFAGLVTEALPTEAVGKPVEGR